MHLPRPLRVTGRASAVEDDDKLVPQTLRHRYEEAVQRLAPKLQTFALPGVQVGVAADDVVAVD